MKFSVKLRSFLCEDGSSEVRDVLHSWTLVQLLSPWLTLFPVTPLKWSDSSDWWLLLTGYQLAQSDRKWLCWSLAVFHQQITDVGGLNVACSCSRSVQSWSGGQRLSWECRKLVSTQSNCCCWRSTQLDVITPSVTAVRPKTRTWTGTRLWDISYQDTRKRMDQKVFPSSLCF